MSNSVEVVLNYVNGRWVRPTGTSQLDVMNPGTGEKLGVVRFSGPRDVDDAVKSANAVRESWQETPITDRVQHLFRLKKVLEDHFEELSRFITVDHGKLLPEARGEMARAIENIDVAIAAPMLMQGRILTNVASGVDVEMDYFPIGTTVIVAPFNFPAMIPFWFMPHAIVTGNTCIVKPSEQDPLTMERVFQLMESAGFPKGVVNLVNGDKTTVDALLEHPGVAGVASVSSTPTMKAIAEKAVAHGKRFICQGGAKNFLVVMPDADLDAAQNNILGSVYGNAGQRCLAGSNVVAVGPIASQLKRRLRDAVDVMKVGYGLESDSQMGPLISQAARDRVLAYIKKGEDEGCSVTVDRRGVLVSSHPRGNYLGPVVFEDVDPRATIAREEIFGPVLIELNAETLDDVIRLINQSPYGNAASIYTQDRKAIRKFKRQVNCGNIGVNIGVPAPIALFPFGGMKESFLGVLHGQSTDALRFFVDVKVTTERV